jgi:hypothetical protein
MSRLRLHPSGSALKSPSVRRAMSSVVLALALVSVIPAVASAAEWKINGSPVTAATSVTWKGNFAIHLQGPGAKAEVRCEDNSKGTVGAKGANETTLSLSKCVNEENCPEPTATAAEAWHASLLTAGGSVMDNMRAEGEFGLHDTVTLKCGGTMFGTNTCTVSNPTMTNVSPNVDATFSFKEGEGSIHNCGSSPYASFYTGVQTIALTKGGTLQVSP